MKVTGISCAILAGGKNLRFGGKTKAIAMVGGRKIIDRIICVAENIFQDITIITNNPEEFADYSHFRLAGDIFRNAGPPGGIHTALCNSENSTVFIVAGDMPFIVKDIILSQIQYFLKTEAEAVVPKIEGRTEPLHGVYTKNIVPVLDSMLKEAPGFPVTDLLQKIRTKYFMLQPSEKIRTAFFNVNIPEDLIKADEISAQFDKFID